MASVSNARISVKKAGCGERNFRDRRNGEKCDFHEETKALRKDPYFRSRAVNAAVGSLSRLQASQPQIGGGGRSRPFTYVEGHSLRPFARFHAESMNRRTSHAEPARSI